MVPRSYHALTVSAVEELSPGPCKSGCFTEALAELLRDRPERTDWVSEAAWSSANSVRMGSLNCGEAGCVGSAGAGKVGVLEPVVTGSGGIEFSPTVVNSGVAGLGTNIVFRTSLRPLSVPDRLAGGAACCRKCQFPYSTCPTIGLSYCA